MDNIKQFEDPLKILKESVPLDKFKSDGLEEIKRIIPISNSSEKGTVNIKNEPNKNKKYKYKGKKALRIKAWIATIVVALGAFASAKEAIQNYSEYMFTSGLVNEMSSQEIMDEIEKILKEEVSQMTGEEIEDIEFYTETKVTTFSTTIVEAGDDEYVHTVDLRGGGDIFKNNTLKSKKLTNLIKAAKGGTREELIKTLRDARKFAQEYELVDDNGVLKAKKVSSIGEEKNEPKKIIEDEER